LKQLTDIVIGQCSTVVLTLVVSGLA